MIYTILYCISYSPVTAFSSQLQKFGISRPVPSRASCPVPSRPRTAWYVYTWSFGSNPLLYWNVYSIILSSLNNNIIYANMDVFFVRKFPADFRTSGCFIKGFYVFEAAESADLHLQEFRRKKTVMYSNTFSCCWDDAYAWNWTNIWHNKRVFWSIFQKYHSFCFFRDKLYNFNLTEPKFYVY